jgi:hypothetical protein
MRYMDYCLATSVGQQAGRTSSVLRSRLGINGDTRCPGRVRSSDSAPAPQLSSFTTAQDRAAPRRLCPDSLSILERVCPLAAPRGRWRCPEAPLALALPLMQRQCGRDAAGGATMHTALPAGQRQRVRSCAMRAALLPEPPDRSAAGSAAVASWQRRCHRCEAGASGRAAVLPAGIAVSGGGGALHCDRAGAAVPQHCDRRADSGP